MQTGNSISIRPASEKDVKAIHDFICELEGHEFDYDDFAGFYWLALTDEHHIILLAEAGGRPIGYLSCFGQLLLHHMGMVYEVQELFVLLEYRSKGVGGTLLSHLESMLRQRPCVLLEVASGRQRTEAHKFYERCGFRASHFKFTKPFE